MKSEGQEQDKIERRGQGKVDRKQDVKGMIGGRKKSMKGQVRD